MAADCQLQFVALFLVVCCLHCVNGSILCSDIVKADSYTGKWSVYDNMLHVIITADVSKSHYLAVGFFKIPGYLVRFK